MRKSLIGRETGNPFIAKDGALIFELFGKDRLLIPKRLSIAVGYLQPRQKARPHYHLVSEEIYYIVRGKGRAIVSGVRQKIKEEDAIYIGEGAIHALENTSQSEVMKVLAICSPSYSDKDIFFVD